MDLKMYEYDAIVRRVIDGDTIEVDIDLGFKTTLVKEKLLLLDIDTPEIRSSNLNERQHAQEAKTYVENLLPRGTTIRVRTEKDKKGKYGRYLAWVYYDIDKTGMWPLLNKDLKKFGYAKKDEYK